MRRRKQDRIFSRIEGMDADLRTGQGSTVQPLKNEAYENLSHPMSSGVAENSALFCKEPGRKPNAAIFENLSPAPEATGEPVPVYRHSCGDTDVLASLERSFVLIAPGSFFMGSPDYETGRDGDETMHEVILTTAFHMQNTPVTQGLWKAVTGANPAAFQGGGDDLPVESISWHECGEFLRKLNSLGNSGYRLPTEAEWEYACRAGSGTAFSNGDISELYCSQDPVLWERGWYCGNSGRKTQPVGRKDPNALGLFDMHGNVGEWCLDWYGDYCEGPVSDPRGPNMGVGKVVRGGSWFSNAKNCRSASRFHWPPNARSDFIGLRLVRQPS